MQELIQLVLDARHKTGEATKYSTKENAATIREACIDLNNGKKFIDPKDVRSGKCWELFALIETVIDMEVNEGLQQSDFFKNFVEEKNISAGDENVFSVKNKNMFKVSEVARGTQGLRRQRLNQWETFSVPMATRGIKIYEEMNRVLAGNVDMNQLIDTVAGSKAKELLDRMYAIWDNLTALDVGGSTYFPASGSYSEDTLISIIDHVEAEAQAKAMVLGSRQALRKMGTSLVSDAAKDDFYNLGYAGKFNGAETIRIEQRHAVGTNNFIFPNDKIFVVATTDKPIKYVTEGDVFINARTAAENADLTEEYTCLFTDGMAWVGSNKMGIYEFS